MNGLLVKIFFIAIGAILLLTLHISASAATCYEADRNYSADNPIKITNPGPINIGVNGTATYNTEEYVPWTQKKVHAICTVRDPRTVLRWYSQKFEKSSVKVSGPYIEDKDIEEGKDFKMYPSDKLEFIGCAARKYDLPRTISFKNKIAMEIQITCKNVQ